MINLSFNIHSIGYLPILSLATAIGIFIISLSFLIGVCIVAVSFIVLIIYTASEYLSLPIFERFLSDMLIRSILRVRILTYEEVISNYLQPLEMEESPQSIEERNKLRQQAIEKLLPLMVYGGGGNHPLKSRECAICLEDYVGGESCRAFPECKHTFHLSCIDRWLENHLTCPVCRKSI